jgi:hypothetical protein
MTDDFAEVAAPEDHDQAKTYDLARLSEIQQECMSRANILKHKRMNLVFSVPPSPVGVPSIPRDQASLSAYEFNSGAYRLEPQTSGNNLILAHEKQLCHFMLEIKLKRRFISDLDDTIRCELSRTEEYLESEFRRIMAMKKKEWKRQASLQQKARAAYQRGVTVVLTGTTRKQYGYVNALPISLRQLPVTAYHCTTSSSVGLPCASYCLTHNVPYINQEFLLHYNRAQGHSASC